MKVGLWNFKIYSNSNSKLRRFRADSKNCPLIFSEFSLQVESIASQKANCWPSETQAREPTIGP